MTTLKAKVNQARKSKEKRAKRPTQKANRVDEQEMQHQNTIRPEKYLSSTLIMKDYSRALIEFSLSSIALPYLSFIALKHSLLLQQFYLFVSEDAEKIGSFQSLRQKLLIFATDADDVAKCKRVFREVCEAFLKYFSVDWIFNSGMHGKMIYLRWRFKLLKRIQSYNI